MLKTSITFLTLVLVAAVSAISSADIVVTEVNSTGSSTIYGADWFELTNTGVTSVDITGWKVDDNSNLFANALELTGITSIVPGQSVVFIEDGTTAAFETAWFGGSPPSGFTIGGYSGSGIGFSSNGDEVNIFDASGTPKWSVSFGAATSGFTFDNAIGLSGTISQLSAIGVNGAFLSANGTEIGSPGTIVPEPSSASIVVISGLGFVLSRLRRKR